jgi:hypothetical protein
MASASGCTEFSVGLKVIDTRRNTAPPGVEPFATKKGADAVCSGRLDLAQNTHFVFHGAAMPLGSGHDFGVRA